MWFIFHHGAILLLRCLSVYSTSPLLAVTRGIIGSKSCSVVSKELGHALGVKIVEGFLRSVAPPKSRGSGNKVGLAWNLECSIILY